MLFKLKTMVYLVDFSIGLEKFGMKKSPPKHRVRGGIRVIRGRVIGGSTVYQILDFWADKTSRIYSGYFFRKLTSRNYLDLKLYLNNFNLKMSETIKK